MTPVLGYWKIRGLAQSIRLLLEYTGTEYTEKLYISGNAPDFSREDWLKEKSKLGLDFPNLPYWIDGDFKITQSHAILRYIAEKHDMIGDTKEERAKVHMLADEVYDSKNNFTRICYNPHFEVLKVDYLKQLPNTLQLYSDYLGTHLFLMGDKITYPDFIIFDCLDSIKVLTPDCLDKFHNLKTFINNFENIAPIKKYLSSDQYMAPPLNNKIAKFGGDA